ncbi:MAG: NAD(P)/FAD-dependent oxidoreductase [Oscillospiraceae bacterium]|nr:NAD(P)/FAD-dependent oxidoreductase [Oscillospiraceae bacterium]
MPKYDAVVIGAGNGGLAAACRMALAGKKTLLIERHNLPGGCASSFRRGRFEFETALHELCEWGTAEKFGACRQTVVDDFGVDLKGHIVPENFRVITTASDGKTKIDATLPCGQQPFIDAMEKYVPGCRKSIEDFFKIGTEFHEAGDYSLSVNGKTDPAYMQEHYPNFLRLGSYPIDKVFNAMKMPKLAQDIMGTYWGYLDVAADKLSFLQYTNMVWLYVTYGAWIPDKTSHELTTGMLESFRKHGGETWFNCSATKILFDDEKAVCGVETTCGTVETKHILCNANPTMVYANMCPPEVVPERMVKLHNAREYSARMFVVYIGLDKSAEELGLHDYSVFMPESADSVREYQSGKTIKDNYNMVSVCYNTVNPDFSPPGTCVISLTTTFSGDDWANVDEEDYFKTKNMMANRLIDRFEEKLGVTIRPYIEEIEVATPWTMCNFVNTPQGSAYGYELSGWDSMMPRMMMMGTEFPVKGLKFVGASSIRGDGYNSAIFSGNTLARKTLSEMKEEEEG